LLGLGWSLLAMPDLTLAIVVSAIG